MIKRGTIAALIVALATLVVSGTAFASAEQQTTGVNWHPQQAPAQSGEVAGATAKLVRRDNGVTYRITTNSLTPGNAYTLWLVVVNNPQACESSPCTGGDVLLNAATDAQVLYGTGNVVGGSGQATFAGSLNEGDLPGWLADRTFDDAQTAEIHLVLNDHGPKLAEFMPGMIKTYRGGCSDSSPFPGIFPPSALADGEAGPNTCRLAQSAIFTTP